MKPPPPKTIGTGTPEFAAALLTDLYVRLRRDLHAGPPSLVRRRSRAWGTSANIWSVWSPAIPEALGARGDDIKLPDGKVAEIKCCYRVDQLGQCRECGAAVASIERVCPNVECGGTELKRQRTIRNGS